MFAVHEVCWRIAIVIYTTFDFDRQQRGLIRQQAAHQMLYQLRSEMTRR